jgi:hypothetical protein
MKWVFRRTIDPVSGEPVVIEDPKNFNQVTRGPRGAVKKIHLMNPEVAGATEGASLRAPTLLGNSRRFGCANCVGRI